MLLYGHAQSAPVAVRTIDNIVIQHIASGVALVVYAALAGAFARSTRGVNDGIATVLLLYGSSEGVEKSL
jgi:hypothetical protein